MKTLIRPAASLFVLLTVVTGVVYPLAVTGVAWLCHLLSHRSRRGSASKTLANAPT